MTLETSSLRRSIIAFPALALVFWLGFGDPDGPLFHGRPLFFWLRQVPLEASARHPETLDALVTLEAHSGPTLRRALTAAAGPLKNLQTQAHRFAPLLFPPPRDLESSRGFAVEVARHRSDQGQYLLPELTEAFRVTSRAEVRESIVQVLCTLGENGMAALSTLALEPDFAGSEAAIRALDGFYLSAPETATNRAHIAAIASARLASSNVNVILAANHALVRTGDAAPMGIPGVFSNLSHGSPGVRAASAQTFARIGRDDPRCIPALLTLLADSNPEVRAASASGLGYLGADAAEAVPLLEHVLLDEPLPVALAALQSLGRIGPKAASAVPGIADLLHMESPSPVLKAAAATALGRIGRQPEKAIPGLVHAIHDPDTYVRCQAARALSAFGAQAEPAVTALSGALFDPVEAVRIHAAEALASIGPAAHSAVPALIAARNNNQSVMSPPVMAALARIQP